MSTMKQKERELGFTASNGNVAAVMRLLDEGVNPNSSEHVSSHNDIDLIIDNLAISCVEACHCCRL